MRQIPAKRGSGAPAAARCGSLALAVVWAAAAVPFAAAATFAIPGLSETSVVQSLASPTDFAWLPDGRLLVLEKAGLVRLVAGGALQAAPALDLTTQVDQFSQQGLLGICVDPAFAGNGYVYIYYTYLAPPPGLARNRISRFHVSGDLLEPASETVLLDGIDASTGENNGGAIAIGPDGKLWAATGDSGTGGDKSQDLSPGQWSGKILRMELDGSAAAGNPFLGDATKEGRIEAYGFRNPFRFAFRPSNGALVVADVGQLTWEEIDVVTAGANYGWPLFEGSQEYQTCASCVGPAFEYDHGDGRAIIGGTFITGNAYSGLQGKYVFGDYINGWIRALDFDSGNAVVGDMTNLATGAVTPVAFHAGPDGLIYYASIDGGKINRINPASSLFHTVAPCRALDTRKPDGPYGGPGLSGGNTRTFHLTEQCGVPPGARSVAVNVTVTGPTTSGDLRIFPAEGALTTASVINFRKGQTRANNAVLLLSSTGDATIRFDAASGLVHLLVDIDGYFE
jgi:glucose/arabinose dehydrogenase